MRREGKRRGRVFIAAVVVVDGGGADLIVVIIGGEGLGKSWWL